MFPVLTTLFLLPLLVLFNGTPTSATPVAVAAARISPLDVLRVAEARPIAMNVFRNGMRAVNKLLPEVVNEALPKKKYTASLCVRKEEACVPRCLRRGLRNDVSACLPLPFPFLSPN